MENSPTESSYRVELMHLRSRVQESRGPYRVVAILFGLYALICVLDKQRADYWPFAVGAFVISIAAALAYRDILNRPRFWALVPAVIWNVIFGGALLVWILGGLIGLISGELTFTEWIGMYSLKDLFGIVLGLALTSSLNERVMSREEAALIEEHRSEWDAYFVGRQVRQPKRKSVRGKPATE